MNDGNYGALALILLVGTLWKLWGLVLDLELKLREIEFAKGIHEQSPRIAVKPSRTFYRGLKLAPYKEK